MLRGLWSNWVRCVFAAMLFMFAVTADVMVKAVVDGAGHDANNPIIWIEHKCAGHYGKATQTPVQPNVTIAAALTETIQLFVPAAPVFPAKLPSQEMLTSLDPPLSLRC